MAKFYSIAQTTDGTRVTFYGVPTARGLRAVREVVPTAASMGPSWRGDSIEFLSELPSIQKLVVVDLRLRDVSAVTGLTKLRHLRLHTYAEKGLDLAPLKSLVEAEITWNRGFRGLSNNKSLRSLEIWRLPEVDIEELRGLSRLTRLTLKSTRVRNFAPVWSLHSLKGLWIGLAPHLNRDQFAGIRQLRMLRVLILQSCRGIQTIDELRGSARLRKCILEDCGEIDSVRALRNLRLLQELSLTGDTQVLDGDLRPIAEHRRLQFVNVRPRKHYTPPALALNTGDEASTGFSLDMD